MNREFLESLGLEKETIDKVMAEHGKTVNTTKDELSTVTTERDNLKEQLTDRDTQLNDLSDKVKDSEELTAEIDRLKKENTTATQDLQNKLDTQAFEFKLDKALNGAKVKNAKAVKALLDTEKIKLDGDKLLNLDDQLEALKESEAYLFEQEDQQQTKPNFTVGNHSKGNNTFTKDDLNKLGYKERVKFKQENPEQYKELTGN